MFLLVWIFTFIIDSNWRRTENMPLDMAHQCLLFWHGLVVLGMRGRVFWRWNARPRISEASLHGFGAYKGDFCLLMTVNWLFTYVRYDYCSRTFSFMNLAHMQLVDISSLGWKPWEVKPSVYKSLFAREWLPIGNILIKLVVEEGLLALKWSTNLSRRFLLR